ncbi:MAG: (5-formylfuran-3-yl)methyl phosphate synthase [Candidatus Nanohaloarchaea archaeon]|nr:(5-formylfuran-3-yl)methyl phosphate synthase [Candidatus Nanohaloarchaea archaeon]
MKSLVTVTDREEAETVAAAGPDILDIKNPAEGSLGAPHPATVRAIMEVVPDDVETSVAVGDVPALPGTVALAVQGADRLSPDYIKIGLRWPETVEDAVEVVAAAVEAAGSADVVVAGFADAERVSAVPPGDVPTVARRAGADAAMLDTAVKDGRNLRDVRSREELSGFVDEARDAGMEAALAGSLGIDDVDAVAETGADILGVRGAVCREGRRSGRIDEEAVAAFVSRCEAVTDRTPQGI